MCAAFTSCITEINNTQVDNTEDINIIMPMHNVIEFSNTYSATSVNVSKYYRDEPAINDNDNIIYFPANNNNGNLFNLNNK